MRRLRLLSKLTGTVSRTEECPWFSVDGSFVLSRPYAKVATLPRLMVCWFNCAPMFNVHQIARNKNPTSWTHFDAPLHLSQMVVFVRYLSWENSFIGVLSIKPKSTIGLYAQQARKTGLFGSDQWAHCTLTEQCADLTDQANTLKERKKERKREAERTELLFATRSSWIARRNTRFKTCAWTWYARQLNPFAYANSVPKRFNPKQTLCQVHDLIA